MTGGCYLAYAIDQVKPWVGRSEVTRIRRFLADSKVSWVFDPGAAFMAPGERTPDIRAINAEALERASIVIALLPAGVSSVGVPMEIERAVAAGKWVLVVSDAPSWMLQFEESNVLVVPSWGADAQEWLREATEGISEGLGDRPRALLPVVVDEGAELPKRGYEDDAGLDLVVSADTVVPPGQYADIPCGVSIHLPEWSWGLIIGRSSTLRSRGLLVSQAVIDAGYRGPIFAGAFNPGPEPVPIAKGERVAQIVIIENGTRRVEPGQVEALMPGSRGSAGFGSTGA